MSNWGAVSTGGGYFAEMSKEEEKTISDLASTRLSDKITSFTQTVNLDFLSVEAAMVVNSVIHERRQDASKEAVARIVEKVIGQVNGLSFLMPIFKRNDISEIIINPDGNLWILKKGEPDFERINEEPLNPQEVSRATDALLRPVGRSINEAVPSVDAKLPRIESLNGLKGGARVKILHPAIVPGVANYPSINIRLFESAPVQPEKLISWNVAPESVIHNLLSCVTRGARLLVIGGTASGKTTFLSAMTNGVPKNARVVKIEDPEEIWMEHPHVVTIEARRAPIGSTSVVDYTLRQGVDDAMRMSPKWLIVGEVRTGDAAASLFRAQMSDHPGLSTFHADSPEAAVERMALIMFMDARIQMPAAKSLFAMGVEALCQVGWITTPEGKRKRALIGVWEVEPKIKNGDVIFKQLYGYGDSEMKPLIRR